MSKITDLIKKEQCSFSFEVTPDITEEELTKLAVHPLFFSITWHAKKHQCSSMDIAPLKLARLLKTKGENVLLHLSCDILKKEFLDEVLINLRTHGICNLFVVLGESFDPTTSDFNSSKNLIEYIRNKTGNYFCIGVAGFPDCNEEKLLHLKEKVTSGADFIITQAFFESKLFTSFIERCTKIGIEVPVIPGVFIFETIKELSGFTKLCKVKVSNDLMSRLNDDASTSISGFDVLAGLVNDIVNNQLCYKTFHIFTINKFATVKNFMTKINVNKSLPINNL